MAQWSSETVVAEYSDVQANAMAVDCNGQLALLAGKRMVTVVSLDKPHENVKKIPRQSKWEISAAQWNPHPCHSTLFITACSQRADMWDWDGSRCCQKGSLKAHTRVISDVDWSPTEPDMVATCSVDAFTHLWDIRECRRPALSLQAVAGASQVKWNRINSRLLATAHDGDIRIWDPRKGTAPVQYIAGHLSKIHGLDWSLRDEYQLASSSQDCTVKFWDVTNPRQAEAKLSSGSPVWRARYTPFGKGLITVVVPQLRRGENSLFLWCLSDVGGRQVHTFVGHTDVVLEFQWRRPHADSHDYQLVTWSKDQSLRLWRIDPQLQMLCDHKVEEDLTLEETPPITIEFFIPNAPPSPDEVPEPTLVTKAATGGATSGQTSSSEKTETLKISGRRSGSSSPAKAGSLKREEGHSVPKTLQQEFSLVNFSIPNMTVEEMDAVKRSCTVSALCGKYHVKLTMLFPENYPYNSPPAFQFSHETNIDQKTEAKLLKVLQDTSLHNVKHNLSCIEPCLRQLINNLESLTLDERKSPDSDAPYSHQQSAVLQAPYLPIYTFGEVQDASVPFPRTSGARFCAFGTLVCFTRRTEVSVIKTRRLSASTDLTPRAMSALAVYTQPPRMPPGAPSIFNMFNKIVRSPPSENAISNYYTYKEREVDHYEWYQRRASVPLPLKHRTRSKSRMKEGVESRRSRDKKHQDVASSSSTVTPGGTTSSASSTKNPQTGPVILYDVSCLLPIHRHLGESYVFDSEDVPAMCRANAAAASAVGRKDLVQMWSLAAMASDISLQADSEPDHGPPWATHPFGRKLLKSLVDHYSCIYDVQTLAMLCCAFGPRYDPQKPLPTPSVTKSTSDYSVSHHKYQIYHTIHPSDTSVKGWNYTPCKIRRSNSSSQINEDYKFRDIQDPAEMEKEQHEKNMRMLDLNQMLQFDEFKKAYAEILYRWELLNTRAEILKYVSTPSQPHKGLEFNAECQHCHQEVRGAQCYHCKEFVIQCAICHVSVKGSSSFCLACGHGGHAFHIVEWFKTHDMCPTGCGCLCLYDNPMASGVNDDSAIT